MEANCHEKDQIKSSPDPHVLIFPLPFQGPVNCALKLAELLCFSGGIRVTFLNTDHIHRPLLRHTDVLSRFSQYPNFSFQTVPDGFPDQEPVSRDQFMELIDSIDAVGKPVFREMLVSGSLSSKSEHPVTVMIPDGWFIFAMDVAEEIGLPLIFLETVSPCCLWTSCLNLPTLIEAGEFPFKGNDLDELIVSVPGIQNFLRRRDLASFCRSEHLDCPVTQLILKEARAIPQAQGLIINTFEELDALVLPHMRKRCSNVYPIGPLHSLHKAQLSTKITPATPLTRSTNSIWKEERSCLAWLDAQPIKSVIYISMGSLATVTMDNLLEIWHGLVSSGKRFLWVRRPGSLTGEYEESRVPMELLEATQQRGCIVGWAPQEDILAHPAVAGFLTHSGWNSTIESIVAGVPMICWPSSFDQQVNSRFVSEIWKIGLEMKDTCDRMIVEKMVRDLMDAKRDEFMQSANTWANLAAESIGKGGSSSNNLGRLIEDIRATSSSRK